MSNELLDAYKELSLNDKRNKFSNELMVIDNILNYIEKKYNISEKDSVKDYKLKDFCKNEDELLCFFYEDIYCIEKKLLTIANLLSLNDDVN